ncbi:hypothetical protein, partial [Salmonella enterica]
LPANEEHISNLKQILQRAGL